MVNAYLSNFNNKKSQGRKEREQAARKKLTTAVPSSFAHALPAEQVDDPLRGEAPRLSVLPEEPQVVEMPRLSILPEELDSSGEPQVAMPRLSVLPEEFDSLSEDVPSELEPESSDESAAKYLPP